MPVLSAFTPCGALACSSAPSHIQEFYNLLPTLWGSEIDFAVGSAYDEPKLYATARMLALILSELEHAGNQQYPLRCYDLLPLLEQDFGLTPGPLDSVITRQMALAAAELIPQGEIWSNVVNSIKTLVGASKFFAYVPAPTTIVGGMTIPRTVYPASPGTGPGQFKDVRVPIRLVKLVDPVVQIFSQSGVQAWVAYTNVDPTIATPTLLYAGDTVVIDGGNTAVMETVTVTATASSAQSQTTPGYSYFRAAFAQPHSQGATVSTGNFPYWWSTQRLAFVVLTALAATDRATRARVDTLMSKISREPNQWAIVQPTSTTGTGGIVGPLLVGSPMGAVSVGAVPYTNAM